MEKQEKSPKPSKQADGKEDGGKSHPPPAGTGQASPNTSNPEEKPCSCKEHSSAAHSSTSQGSINSQANVSVEVLAQTKSCDRHPVPYSEQTQRQIEHIKQLVEEQEKETAEKMANAAVQPATDAGRNPENEISTTFAQDMTWIREQIRKAHAERERQEERDRNERKERKEKERRERGSKGK